ncbi:MAG: nuclear transport factor 2 family protein [Terracoccus sp.]
MSDSINDNQPGTTTDIATDVVSLEGEAARVWAVLNDLYAAYLEGDRDRLESHLAAGCTMWDSTIPLLRTKEDLQAGRVNAEPAEVDPAAAVAGSRDPDYPAPVGLDPTEPVVGLLGDDAAWETHLLAARFDDGSLDELLRCTSVLRRDEGGTWRVAHHHEELLSGPGRPAPVRQRR